MDSEIIHYLWPKVLPVKDAKPTQISCVCKLAVMVGLKTHLTFFLLSLFYLIIYFLHLN